MNRRGLLALAATGFGSLGTRVLAEDNTDPDRMYEALAAPPTLRLNPPGGVIDVVLTPEIPAAQRPTVVNWIELGIAALVQYFGQFPVKHLGLLILSGEGRRVGHGTAYGYAGSAIRIAVGRDAERADFLADWVLVHEMVHLAFPTVPRRHLWIEEGSATYVEPVARAMAGQLTAASVWQQFRRGMPQGLPKAGDEGLDNTHTWGRTYWGGALFCLLADVEILRRTHQRRGLRDALNAVRVASGGNSTRWTMDKAVQLADEAVGVPVLSEMYRDMRDRAVATDLDALFTQLGVSAQGETLDETAPLSAIRRAITTAL